MENERLRQDIPSLLKTPAYDWPRRPDLQFFGVSGENLCVIKEKKPGTMDLDVLNLRGTILCGM